MTEHAAHRPNVALYLKVFGALLVLTVVTVAVSHLDLPKGPGIAVGILIALVKAGLVAAFFMHLKGEKALIFALLAVTVFFMLHLFVLPVADHHALQERIVPIVPQGPGDIGKPVEGHH